MAAAARDIWASCRGPAQITARELEAWRVVEGQHVISTRKLVDDLAEQELLEELIESAKPPPPGIEFEHLHFLLYTPFRYPPLRHGSRFGTPAERGLWYGSVDRQTAFAERAYYRLLFLDGGPDLGTVAVQETAFTALVRAAKFVDLGGPPFSKHEAEISSPTSYAAAHALGAAMRVAGVEGFAFTSARAKVRGINIGLFEPVFGNRSYLTHETWNCTASRTAVEFFHMVRGAYSYPRADFEVKGRLPHPGV